MKKYQKFDQIILYDNITYKKQINNFSDIQEPIQEMEKIIEQFKNTGFLIIEQISNLNYLSENDYKENY